MDFTLGLGSPDPDLICAVRLARLHLSRFYRPKGKEVNILWNDRTVWEVS